VAAELPPLLTSGMGAQMGGHCATRRMRPGQLAGSVAAQILVTPGLTASSCFPDRSLRGQQRFAYKREEFDALHRWETSSCSRAESQLRSLAGFEEHDILRQRDETGVAVYIHEESESKDCKGLKQMFASIGSSSWRNLRWHSFAVGTSSRVSWLSEPLVA
jgi:hypothetical protein